MWKGVVANLATPINKMESSRGSGGTALIQSTAGAVPVRNEKGKDNKVKIGYIVREEEGEEGKPI